MLEGNEHSKYKGIKKSAVKTKITHDDYNECLFGKTTVYRSMIVISLYKHDMYTEEVNTIVLYADDDKKVYAYSSISGCIQRFKTDTSLE